MHESVIYQGLRLISLLNEPPFLQIFKKTNKNFQLLTKFGVQKFLLRRIRNYKQQKVLIEFFQGKIFIKPIVKLVPIQHAWNNIFSNLLQHRKNLGLLLTVLVFLNLFIQLLDSPVHVLARVNLINQQIYQHNACRIQVVKQQILFFLLAFLLEKLRVILLQSSRQIG